MSRCYAFSMRRFIRYLPCHLAVEDPLTQLLRRITPTVRRFIRCWRPCGQNVSVCFFVTVGWTDAFFDHGVSSSGAEGFVLARLCLDSNWASDRPTVSSLIPSDHPVLLSSLLLLCNSSDATRKWTVGSSDGALVFTQCTNSSDDCTDACYLGTVGSADGVLSFCFLSCFWPLKNRLSSQFGMWYFGILGT
jgi:hypothetical protein